MADLYSLALADEPTAEEQGAALAAALRRQQSAGYLGQLTGDPVLSRVGTSLLQGAQHQQDQLNQLPAQRLRMALEKEQLAKTQAEQLAANSKTSARTVLSRALTGQLMPGVQIPEDATAAQLEPVLPTAERAYQARTMAQVARNRMTGGPLADAFSPEAINQLAQQFASTGQMPSVGYGLAGAAIKAKVANRAAQLQPGNDLAGAHAEYGANSGSLKKLQTQADSIDAFERTALANLDTFLNTAHQVVDVGSPLFNAPARVFAQKVAGDPRMAAFNAARETAINEISKALSGATGTTAVSDSARHEAASLLSPDASLAQIEAAAQVLKRDMANRKAAVASQLGEIRGRVGGHKQAEAQAAPAAQAAGPDIRTRIAQLKGQGLSNDAIKAQLKKEGLVP